MAQWTVFTDSDFWKRPWAHAVISLTEPCLFLIPSYLRARRSRASTLDFLSCPLHSDFSRFKFFWLYHDLLPINHLHSHPIIAVPNYFENSRWVDIAHETVKCLTFIFWYGFYVLLWMKYCLIHFGDLLDCIISQLFWKFGLYLEDLRVLRHFCCWRVSNNVRLVCPKCPFAVVITLSVKSCVGSVCCTVHNIPFNLCNINC